MANTRDIRFRIRSVQNIRQITRAMEMVSATKMRRAQQAVVLSRDYADKARGLLAAVQRAGVTEKLPLLAERPVKRRGVVVLTSDRGLCGAMNTNIVRTALREYPDANTRYISVGRQAQNTLRNQGRDLLASFTGLSDTPHYTDIGPVARVVIEEFTNENLDEIALVYPKFVSTLVNEPVAERLLPSPPAETAEENTGQAKAITLFEPSPEAVLTDLLPRLVEIQLWQALLETKASEHSSRMIAMRNASNNASDLLDELRFTYNQIRQAGITTEIAEIAAASNI